jgi:hypothetical protein
MDDRDVVERLRRIGAGAQAPEPAYERMLTRKDRKRRNSRFASGIMAFVVLAAGMATAAVAFTGHGVKAHHGGSYASSGGNSNLVAGPGQYYYWKTERIMNAPNVVEEMWWGEDGSGRYVADQTNPDYGTPSDQSWQPSGFPGVFPFETDLSGLSTDPSVLRSQLLDRSAPTGASPQPQVTMAPSTSLDSSELWNAGTQILQMGNATPALRAALFDVLSGLPEATTGRGTDPVGRDAITVTMDTGDGSSSDTKALFFDPSTHLLLAMVFGQRPTLIVLDGGIVDSTQATPTEQGSFFQSVSNAPPQQG